VLYERDEPAEAIEWWARAAEAGDAESAFNAGVALEDLGRYDDAIDSYRRAAKGGHAAAHTNIGILLEHTGDGIGAEDAYRSGIEGDDASAAFNLGVLLYRRGDDEGARDAFTRAQELGDEDAVGALDTLDDDPDQPDDYDDEAVRVLIEQGEADPDQLLPVEHWLYFSDEEAARRAAHRAGQNGFALQLGPSANDDGTWVVRATRHMYPRPEAFARARHPLARLATEEGGEYDGWEAPKR
jgi:tetratricopeptide (TPR) repeat protein